LHCVVERVALVRRCDDSVVKFEMIDFNTLGFICIAVDCKSGLASEAVKVKIVLDNGVVQWEF
jgi:hypothetical protein